MTEVSAPHPAAGRRGASGPRSPPALVARLESAGHVWRLDALGYLVSFIAIRRGHSRDVLT